VNPLEDRYAELVRASAKLVRSAILRAGGAAAAQSEDLEQQVYLALWKRFTAENGAARGLAGLRLSHRSARDGARDGAVGARGRPRLGAGGAGERARARARAASAELGPAGGRRAGRLDPIAGEPRRRIFRASTSRKSSAFSVGVTSGRAT
jgi:hypothetical protein